MENIHMLVAEDETIIRMALVIYIRLTDFVHGIKFLLLNAT